MATEEGGLMTDPMNDEQENPMDEQPEAEQGRENRDLLPATRGEVDAYMDAITRSCRQLVDQAIERLRADTAKMFTEATEPIWANVREHHAGLVDHRNVIDQVVGWITAREEQEHPMQTVQAEMMADMREHLDAPIWTDEPPDEPPEAVDIETHRAQVIAEAVRLGVTPRELLIAGKAT